MPTETPLNNAESLRNAIRRHYLAADDALLEQLLPSATLNNTRAVYQNACRWVTALRQQTGQGSIDRLLNEFSLSTDEGVVLMCLAEALLRVPDSETADALIRDKLLSGDWEAHVGHSDSLFVNASAWALLFTGRMASYSDREQQALHGVLTRAIGRLGQPVIRSAVRYAMGIMGDSFVIGESIEQAMKRAAQPMSRGYRYSFDMLGEGARTEADAQRYLRRYQQAIDHIGPLAAGRGPLDSPGISVKLSALHPRYEFASRQRVLTELVPRLKALAVQARAFDIGLTVDAEEAERLELSLDVIQAVFTDPDLGDWQGFGLAVQAYQKRAPAVIDWLQQLARNTGRRLMVRLVKGAYWDTEIKRAQILGVEDYPVFTRKAATDVCYQACASKLLGCRTDLYPQFATHNAYTVAAILDLAGEYEGFEFQRLYGMGEALYEQLMSDLQVPCRIYAPVGEHVDLLAYLVRRLLENGANTSFVNNVVDDQISLEEILIDPVEAVSEGGYRHPAIPLPKAIYGQGRVNARGISLADPLALEQLQEGLNGAFESLTPEPGTGGVEVVNPADTDECLGVWVYDDADSMAEKLEAAQKAFKGWSQTSTEQRAGLLERFADALEAHRDELMALCIKEAGKTLADSLAEVREAVDFCRYYAQQARQLFAEQPRREPLGVVLCISPWNFPLAIGVGQVTAALVTGNTVIAKPAEQTSLIAQKAWSLLRSCGLPDGVVQLVIAPGPLAGENLVPDTRVQAVMFTGSTATGRWLFDTLAKRDDAPIPLVAETGGQNAMVVDSSALPEQVVDDVIRSAFLSAGQRCSALRVLFLQEEVAPTMIDMLIGAMRELSIGDPARLSTDIGPLIDDRAVARMIAHVDDMQGKARLLYLCELPQGRCKGHFFAPRLYEIEHLSVLPGEVFGPILHVVRYRADELDNVIAQINASGYGLTLGVHSRIQRSADRIARSAQVGNVYVNRDMVGAVVGVQPFGGRGLSGTGPKAGGPHYLARLTRGGQGALADLPEQCDESIQQPLRHELASSLSAVEPEKLGVSHETWSRQKAYCLDLAGKAIHLLTTPRKLPGPTGESNRLFYEPRGQLVCVQGVKDDPVYWLTTLVTALVSGNELTVFGFRENVSWLQSLMDSLTDAGLSESRLLWKQVSDIQDIIAFLGRQPVTGVVLMPDSPVCAPVMSALAGKEAALPGVICEKIDSTFPLHFVLEKTVTINTTAAGGNASLMTLSDSK